MLEERKAHLEEDTVLLLNKGKRSLSRLIFGRTGIVVLLLAAQMLLLIAGFWKLSGTVVYGVSVLLGLTVTLTIVNKPANPASKITWILLILLAPVFGIPFYLFVSMDWGHRIARGRLEEIDRKTARFVHKDLEGRRLLREENPPLSGLAAYMERNQQQLYYRDSQVKYLPTGEAFFAEALAQLKKAKHFIFLEYFIVEEGYMWGRILRVLQQKVKEGVEVRLLYDGTCAFGKLPYHYPRKLEELGIRCKMYAPLRPLVSTHYNNRDHRKILVIDGRTAFTGGINLADEYINKRVLHGHWKDTAVMLTGAAVRSFTLMFLQMWSVSELQEPDYSAYLDASRPAKADGWVLPYGSSPFQREKVGEMAYMSILNQASEYVHITTPYLIIDHEMVTALTFAAKRGVDVKMILPGIPDKKTVFALTRSYYQELIDGGVEIYEYTPGFIHAKMFVSDGRTAVVGSINLDYRSLYLHFECAALMYRCGAVADVEKDFQRTLAKCRRITAEDCRKDHLFRRLTGWLLRPLAPLM